MRNNTVFPYGNQFAYEGMRLNATTAADLYASLDLYEWADEAIIPYPALIKIDRFDDSDILTEYDISNLGAHYFRLAHDDKISTTFLAWSMPVKQGTPSSIQSKK